jgi:cob(I)alamin adenosyltransferase
MLNIDALLLMLGEVPQEVEIVLTGRNAPQRLIDQADLVSEIKDVKHYFRRGIKARKGIEF